MNFSHRLVNSVLFVLLLFTAAQGQAHSVAIRNVTLIDMTSDRSKPGMTVVIAGNRISRIGKDVKIRRDTQVIDGTGKFLLPGLWDNYTFTLEAVKSGLPYFEMLIANGVTGVRDTGTSMDPAGIGQMRSDMDRGKLLGPRLFYAGKILIGEMPPRNSNRWTGISTIVKSEADVKTAVDSLSRAGVDHIKVEKRTSPHLLKLIIANAHKQNRPVVAVPPSFIKDASDDGLDCIEHFAEIGRATSNKREQYYALYRDHTIDSMTTDQNYAFFGTMDRDAPYYSMTLKTLSKNKTCVITNAAQTDTFIGDYELRDTSRRRYKTTQENAALDAKIIERERQIRNNDYRMSDKNRARHYEDIREMHRAGVMLLAGTQLSKESVGTPGMILHDELSIFVQAGLSPFEALKTATVNPAKFMRREKDLGTIKKGKLADMILLDANPLEDISNTRKINAVITNGRYLSRDALDKMLGEVERRAKNK